jgi:hypothetical protein
VHNSVRARRSRRNVVLTDGDGIRTGSKARDEAAPSGAAS